MLCSTRLPGAREFTSRLALTGRDQTHAHATTAGVQDNLPERMVHTCGLCGGRPVVARALFADQFGRATPICAGCNARINQQNRVSLALMVLMLVGFLLAQWACSVN
jgi:hypothetical protein